MPNPRTPAPVPGAPVAAPRFAMVFPTLWTIITTWGLSPVEIHVLAFLASRVRMGGNLVDVAGHAAIAAGVGHDRTSVGRALTHLKSLDAVRVSRPSTRETFEVNPYLVFRGGLAARERVIARDGWRLPANTRTPRQTRRRAAQAGPA